MTQPDGSADHLFGSGPEPVDWDEPAEDAPEPAWDPGPEADDQGGMTEFDPRADEVARQEWERSGPELGG